VSECVPAGLLYPSDNIEKYEAREKACRLGIQIAAQFMPQRRSSLHRSLLIRSRSGKISKKLKLRQKKW
jgi:hypothetical protein